MWRRKSLGLFGNWTTTKAPTRFATGGRAHHPVRPFGARRLRFEPLEDRRLLTVTIDLLTSSDTGRDAHDNVTKSVGHDDIVVGATASAGIEVALTGIGIYVDGHCWVLPSVGTRYFFAPGYQPPVSWDWSLLEGDHVVQAAVAYEYIEISVPPATGSYWMTAELTVTVDSTPPGLPSMPDLLESSDSGRENDDNVTNVTRPVFQGYGEPNAILRLWAKDSQLNDVVLGEGLVSSEVTKSADGDPLGSWMVATESLVDGVYDIWATQEDVAGNVSDASAALQIEIDTLAPDTPYLDVADASDTGRSNTDNITQNTAPEVTMTTEDPNAASHIKAENLIYRVFDRPPGGTETLIYDSVPFHWFTTFTSDNQLTTTLSLGPDGVHNLKLEVEDRAGNISDDFLLPVTIDTVAPPVSIIDINPATTDTGVEDQPETFSDRITSDTATGFIGRAEADAIVRLYADAQRNGTIDLPAEFALSEAVPLDGNLAFPNGEWRTSFLRDLNHPGFFPLDGLREIIVEAEDLAGNVNVLGDGLNDEDQILETFIDTRGPQVTAVYITNDPGTATDESLFDLFVPKPSAGPTPLVSSLSIDVRDLPERTAGFLYEALARNAVNGDPATEPGHFLVRGDHNGAIRIESVAFNPVAPAPGGPATGTIVLTFFEPLPDDRFTLTISDSLVDPAGNRLDGESNAVEPQSPPVFPSGDGQPGGDFVARFTVDSRAEIGVWAAGSVYLDTNGNFTFDPQNPDFTNRDITYTLGLTTDYVFAGNFAAGAGGRADGFDKLAAYSRTAAGFRWLVDTTNNGVPNLNVLDPSSLIGVPVAGNFDGKAANGDEVGVFTGRQWWFDTNHDFLLSNETPRSSGIFGHPVVGNFDNHGREDLAAWDINTNTFSLSLSSQGGGFGNPVRTAQFRLGWGLQFIGVRQRPVAADMDGDGIDDLGFWVPDRGGMTPAEGAEWYFLISGGNSIATRIVNNTVAFSSVPFGNDLFAQFGDEFGVPVVGNFDPPGPATTVVQAPSNPTVSASTPGLYDPAGASFHLKNSNATGGGADIMFKYGPRRNRGWKTLVGDFDGDGIDTVGLYDPVVAGFHLKNSHAQGGGADIIFRYGPGGNRGWQALIGDFDGDGIDTVGLYDPVAGKFHLKNSNTQGGGADVIFAYGPGGSRGWKPLAGDFDGDGVDTVGLYDPQTGGFHLKNSHAPAGGADMVFCFGPARPWWQPLLGDWDGDGIDTVGLYAPGTAGFHLKNSHTQGGGADVVFSYGPANRGWVPLVGNWNGSGGSPLLAAGGESASSPVAQLLEAELESAVAAAVSRWDNSLTGAGRSAVDYVIADLPGSLLGWTESDMVYIDRTAAGHGWFVDPTPARDEEFGRIDSGRDLRALDPRAAGRMDLLTVISHELGHTRGLEDLDSSTDSLMSGALEPGVRRMPPTADGHASSARDVTEPPAGKLSLSGNQRLGEPQTIAQHVIRLLQIGVPLPSYLEYRVTFNAAPKSSTRWSNALMVFDYKSSTDYKFAGAFVGIDYWTIGRMTDRGYVMDKSIRKQIDSDTDYKLQLVLQGSTATLKVGGVTKVSHTYDDFFQGGQLGLASLRGNARFDDLSVREL